MTKLIKLHQDKRETQITNIGNEIGNTTADSVTKRNNFMQINSSTWVNWTNFLKDKLSKLN